MFQPNACVGSVVVPRSGASVLTALTALLLLAGIASATTIKVTDVDTSRGESIWIKENGVDTDAYFAGIILISVFTEGTEYDRDSVCVDLFTDIYLKQVYDTVLLRPDEVPEKDLLRVAWLVDNAVPPVPLPSPALAEVTTPEQGAGLQLAIWDIVHDSGDGFTTGSVQFAAATPQNVRDWAKYYEDQSLGKQSDLAFVYENFIQGSTTQAQMLIGPGYYHDDGPEPPTPEPSTFALALGALLIGVARLFRPRLGRFPMGR
ncbi:MAG: thioester domain-containing protein [Bryobacteraceae bacterium]|jgi:hypothetical protein